jgi:predicted O-methyltransferase YrrM
MMMRSSLKSMKLPQQRSATAAGSTTGMNRNGTALLLMASFVAGLLVSALWPRQSSPTIAADRVSASIPIMKQMSSIPIMAQLSQPATFLSTIERLYEKYGGEVKALRQTMRKWCEQTQSCKFTDFEVEMLYMLIREIRPQKVFEMAPNRGFSSHWILAALHQNDNTSTLSSIDLHDNSVKHMSAKYKDRWTFTMGDYEQLLKDRKLQMDQYDFIFIDALHTEEFSRGYCQKLLLPHKHPQTIVAIHDIVADHKGGGRESAEVYKYLAWENHVIQNIFTMSRYGMPNFFRPVENAIAQLHAIRAKHGIVKPCDPPSLCQDAMHDVLYFANNDAPTIFFQLN